MPQINAVTETDIIAYQARKLAEYERKLNDLRSKLRIMEKANEDLADALSCALGGRDRVFVPRRRCLLYTYPSPRDSTSYRFA